MRRPFLTCLKKNTAGVKMAVDFGCQQNMISSIPGDNISRKAFGALRGHAGLFMECGMLDQQEHSGVISLQNHKTSLDLLFHVRRKLLSRVYHLRIVSRMVPKNGHGSDDHYRLGLKVSGIRRFKHRFSIHGKGHVAGKALADQLILSGLIQQLTEMSPSSTFPSVGIRNHANGWFQWDPIQEATSI